MVRQHESLNDLGITTLHHADVYRVESLDEVLDLALGELVEENAVAIVEWGDIATSVFGRDVLTVTFLLDDGEGRTLVVDGALGESRADALKAWAAA
jgi:tRNA A37 threonylcarbamoyladenosine biosynthesis protein TsaE